MQYLKAADFLRFYFSMAEITFCPSVAGDERACLLKLVELTQLLHSAALLRSDIDLVNQLLREHLELSREVRLLSLLLLLLLLSSSLC